MHNSSHIQKIFEAIRELYRLNNLSMIHDYTYDQSVVIQSNYNNHIIEELKENISLTCFEFVTQEHKDRFSKILIEIERELEN